MSRYSYCGLAIESAFDLPELEPLVQEVHAAITVEHGEDLVPPAAASHRGANWAIADQVAWWWLEGVARFRIEPGRVQLEPLDSAAPGFCRTLLIEAPLVLAMLQLGEFCLRVSAVARGNRALAFSGPAGTGKSTQAAGRIASGWELLSDSVLRITFDATGGPQAWPQGSGMLLWPDSVERLELGAMRSRPVRDELSVRRVYPPAAREAACLERVGQLEHYSTQPLSTEQRDLSSASSAQTFTRLGALTAGRCWIEGMGRNPEHFRWLLGLARTCEIGPA